MGKDVTSDGWSGKIVLRPPTEVLGCGVGRKRVPPSCAALNGFVWHMGARAEEGTTWCRSAS